MAKLKISSRLKWIILLALLVLRTATLSAQSPEQQLDFDDVMATLEVKDATTGHRMVMILRRCISFKPTEAQLNQLKDAGADDALIGAIQSACYKPSAIKKTEDTYADIDAALEKARRERSGGKGGSSSIDDALDAARRARQAGQSGGGAGVSPNVSAAPVVASTACGGALKLPAELVPPGAGQFAYGVRATSIGNEQITGTYVDSGDPGSRTVLNTGGTATWTLGSEIQASGEWFVLASCDGSPFVARPNASMWTGVILFRVAKSNAEAYAPGSFMTFEVGRFDGRLMLDMQRIKN